MVAAVLDHNVLVAIGEGLKTTLLLSAALVGVIVVVGIPVGVLETSERLVLRVPARATVELFRGIPTIVTLFFVFFFLPSIGLLVPAFYAVLIGLSLWGSANVGEITRGAVSSVDRHSGSRLPRSVCRPRERSRRLSSRSRCGVCSHRLCRSLQAQSKLPFWRQRSG